MKSDAEITVALKSREQAKSYFLSGNFGRSFAHYLVALKLMPQWKTELKSDFSASLCAWGNQLESQERFKDLFSCYEQATEIFPEHEDIICNLGAYLFRLGHLREAAHYFREALKLNENYLPAYRNLQSVCSSLVERWHFRMLNDSHRNEAYREGIMKKIQQGFVNVLDIGTGTGILSMYAVASGASSVYACDYSPTMCAIAGDVFTANNMADKVDLINKLSNNLTIPEDLPQRMSLVITETMDAGLLGENVLQTVSHAWQHLLKPPCPNLLSLFNTDTPIPDYGVVLPFGATLWAVPVQCPKIAKQCYIVNSEHSTLTFKSVWVHSDIDEPYDTENLRLLKNCRYLADPQCIFKFDFNNPSEVKEFYEGKMDGTVIAFNHEEKADALVVWFNLILDEDISISSSPLSSDIHCCWDQAVFRCKRPQSNVTVQANCGGGKVSFNFDVSKPQTDTVESLTTIHKSFARTSIIPEVSINKDTISFINNADIHKAASNLPKFINECKSVLDLSLFPVIGLNLVKTKDANLVCVLETDKLIVAVKELMQENNIDSNKVKCLLKSGFMDLSPSDIGQFDLIYNDVIDTTGELNENAVNMIPKLMNMLSPEGKLSPSSLSVQCQLIESEWVRCTSRVTNDDLTHVYNVAQFINIYQVSQQLDVDLKNIPFKPLSDTCTCLRLTIDDLSSDNCHVKELSIMVSHSGHLTAVPLWFDYHLGLDGPSVSTLSENSHVNQVVFLVEPAVIVHPGQWITVNLTYHCGIFKLNVKAYCLIYFSFSFIMEHIFFKLYPNRKCYMFYICLM